MPVTKITLSTAMRARDVSRPHAEHLTEAAQREEAATRPAETPPPRPARPPAPASQSGTTGTPGTPAPLPVPAPPPSRRRRRRGR